MWHLRPSKEYEKKASKWPKKHRRELAAVHANLDTFLQSLRAGGKVQQLWFGFLHAEPSGVKAIDQKGGGSGLKQTRLYVYADEATQIIHLITLGGKDSQDNDVRTCTDFVDSLRNEDEQAGLH